METFILFWTALSFFGLHSPFQAGVTYIVQMKRGEVSDLPTVAKRLRDKSPPPDSEEAPTTSASDGLEGVRLPQACHVHSLLTYCSCWDRYCTSTGIRSSHAKQNRQRNAALHTFARTTCCATQCCEARARQTRGCRRSSVCTLAAFGVRATLQQPPSLGQCSGQQLD